MTRLSFLRLLGLMPAARYGSMGQVHRRPDQMSDPPPSAVAPSQAGGTQRARQVIIFGTGVNVGLFVYTGTPAPGNPPQVAIVPNTTTTDPFTNAIGLSKILIQANVITESGGIFRTAAAAPLIQLDGPHDAEWVYDASANLIAALASQSGNDGLGHNYPAGVTAFVIISAGASIGTWAINLGTLSNALPALTLQNQTHPFFIPPSVSGQGEGGINGSQLALSSGDSVSTAAAAIVTLLDSVAAGNTSGLIETNVPVALVNEAAPAVVAGFSQMFSSNATGMARFLADSTKGDSEVYDTGTNHRDNASPVTLSNTVFTSVFADMPIAALKYRINADLVIQMGAVSTTLLLKLVGPAVAAVTNVKWRATAESGTVIFAGHSSGSLASVTTVAWAINAVVHVWMSADVSFTAASGTNLNLQAQLGAASATTQVLAGSTMDVSPVG